MKIRKTLIVKTLLMHKICAKYLVVPVVPQLARILLKIIPVHVSNERPILVKLFLKLMLVMAQMITYYQVPSLEVLADIFTCLRSI